MIPCSRFNAESVNGVHLVSGHSSSGKIRKGGR